MTPDNVECCTGQSYDTDAPLDHDNKVFAHSFGGKWYACIDGQLKLIPQQCTNREEALCATRTMMQANVNALKGV